MSKRDEQNTKTVKEDVQEHERKGLRINDQEGMGVDLDENGAIQEKDKQNLWV